MFNNVAPVIEPSNVCCFHRIALPLENAGFNFEELKQKPMKEYMIGRDVLFFSRTTVSPHVVELAKEKMQLKIAMDLDDHWYIPVQHINHASAVKDQNELKTLMLIDVADVVICTTKRLADQVIQYNKNVWIIPNAIPFDGPGSETFKPIAKPEGEVRFGWVGGVSHLRDMQTISGLFRAYPKLNFTLCGYYNVTGIPNVWDKLEAICSQNGRNKNYKRRQTLKFSAYMNHYNHFDVALAPLEATAFNSFKSGLKIYEAGAKKCACIVSAVPPYTDEEAPVTYCKTSNDWKQAIKKHMDRDYAQQQGEKLYQWVKEHHDMADTNKIREHLFKLLSNGTITKHSA